jgi:EAL domain-containing protein (putative c-di-GMP-specific phosphodiesterase class I)
MKYSGKSLAIGARPLVQPDVVIVPDLFSKLAGLLSGSAKHFATDRALNTDRIALHYQPKIDLITGLPTGVEALVRWRGHEDRIVPPDEFLPRIQTMKHMLALDLHVLEKAIRQSAAWAEQGITPVISVNMSAGHFDSITFADRLEEVLAKVPHFNPRNLAIEILESVAIKNIKVAAEIIGRLRARGTRFYLDDFGTGHSSAAYLKSFPIDAIKVDQVFARDIPHGPSSAQDTAIIEASVSVAHAFGVNVIAEGIETREAAMEVKRLGCHMGQGYFFARPLPEEQFAAWYSHRCATVSQGIAI